jgi:hypothetical protein
MIAAPQVGHGAFTLLARATTVARVRFQAGELRNFDASPSPAVIAVIGLLSASKRGFSRSSEVFAAFWARGEFFGDGAGSQLDRF